MKKLLLGLLLTVTLFSSQRDIFVENYKNKNYNRACGVGSPILEYYRKDEDFVSAYGFACLYSDNIDLIAPAVMYLKNSEEGRKNAAYLSSIVAIKKILYMSVVDGFDIGDLNFPKLDHILSTVFQKYVREDYIKNENKYIFTLNETEKIVMEKRISGNRAKLYIQKYKNNNVEKTHIYW